MSAVPRVAFSLCTMVAAAGLVLLPAAPVHGCPWHKSKLVTGAWLPSPWAPGFFADSLAELPADLLGVEGSRPTSVAVGDPPGAVGRWDAPMDWPVIAIHAALMPDGRVLHYSYPDGAAGSNAQLWNPRTGEFQSTQIDNDIFCSGLTFLADGRLLVTGGNDYACSFQGRRTVYTLATDGLWTQHENMSVGRWYPTNVSMGDGSALIFSGLDRQCGLTDVLERFTPSGNVSEIPAGARQLQLYPRLHLLSSGLVAHVGPEVSSYTWDPVNEVWDFVDNMSQYRWDGTSFMVPGEVDEVMTCAGSVSATCERIDFSEPSPQWRFTGAMSFERSHANALILPDRRVLIVGGGTDGLYGSPIMNAELYDPDTESWTLLPPQIHGRMYHSTTVLLPDGRVISAGQDSGASAYKAEIYNPPYLFQGPRPRIQQAPRRIRYGDDFTLFSPDAAEIDEIALIRLTTVTHSVNNNQRYVGLAFTPGAGQLAVTAPSNPNLAPPGHYMLFILRDGIPGVARIVQLR